MVEFDGRFIKIGQKLRFADGLLTCLFADFLNCQLSVKLRGVGVDYELVNQAHNPQGGWASKRKVLQRRLAEWIAQTGDSFHVPID